MLKNKLKGFFSWVRRMLKPPRKLKFTRLGTFVVLLTFGIGFAAMNTGNNLVYMVFGMMLGVITASGIISEMSLRGLEIDWILPGEITARKPASIRLILKNTKRTIPSLGIWVQIPDPFSNRAPTSPQKFLRAFFLFVPAAGQRSRDLTIHPDKRGKYILQEIKVETQFPFGFFKKSLVAELNGALMVYPAHVPISSRIEANAAKQRDASHPNRGWGDNFWGLRDYAQGDNPRRIAWKSSAKRDRWITLETEKDLDRELMASLTPLSDWQQLSADELEEAVSFTATYLIKNFEWGISVGLSSENFYAAPSNQKNELSKILRYLAVFNPLEVAGRAQVSDQRGSRSTSVPMLALWSSQR